MSRSAFPPASAPCARYAPTLLALFDGQTLDVALLELNDAQAHLHECAACRKQWHDWELTRDALRATTPPPPAALRQRVTLAVRLRAPFESVPTPPPGLREAILRATIGVRNAVQACAPDDAEESEDPIFSEDRTSKVETYEPLSSSPVIPLVDMPKLPRAQAGGGAQVGGGQSRATRRASKARTATAWLTPVLAAWLMVLSTRGQWNKTRDIELPTLRNPTSLRSTARSVKAKAARVLNRLHLGGVAHSAAAALRGGVAKVASAPTPSDEADDKPDATPHDQPAPRESNESEHENARRDGGARRDRDDDRAARDNDNREREERDSGPRFQMASWHPERRVETSERRVEVEEPPASQPITRVASAPALSSVPERRMNGARGGTRLAMIGPEDSPRTVTGRAMTLPSRFWGGRRLNVVIPTRSSSSMRLNATRLNTTHFAPNQVVSPQLVNRVSSSDAPDDALNDNDTPQLRLSDHRPAEISQVMDDFRAALDEDE